MKDLWRLMTLLLLLCVITACSVETDTGTLDTEIEAEEEEEALSEWELFTQELFATAFTDTVTLHYYVQNPEDYGIEIETTLGTLYSDETEEDEDTWASDTIAEMEALDYDALTEEEQFDYDTLLWYLETAQLAESETFDYYSALAEPTYGIPANFPITMANYAFNEEDDVWTYLTLLEDTARYFEELFLYEQERTERGYGLTDTLIDEMLEECESFIAGDAEDNVLVVTFDERADELWLELGLDDETLEACKETNLSLVEDVVIPAYETFMENMESLKGESTGSGSVAEYAYGTEYFEYLARQASSSDRSIEDMQELLEAYFDEQYVEFVKILMKDYSLIDEMDDPDYGASEPEEILELIADRMDEIVPEIGDAVYTVKYVPESLEEALSPVFCFVPQVDNVESVIYINQNPDYDNMDFFITLAHEGYPGHMYQQTYYYGTDPDPFRLVLDYSGYTEGWAVYISYRAVALSDIGNEDLVNLITYNESISYIVSALADIGVNYEGWDLDELEAFFVDHGFSGVDVEAFYDVLISSPGTYLSYGEAYCEFLELKEKASEAMGAAFDEVSFHEVIMDAGPTSFTLLEEKIEAYIEENS